MFSSLHKIFRLTISFVSLRKKARTKSSRIFEEQFTPVVLNRGRWRIRLGRFKKKPAKQTISGPWSVLSWSAKVKQNGHFRSEIIENFHYRFWSWCKSTWQVKGGRMAHIVSFSNSANITRAHLFTTGISPKNKVFSTFFPLLRDFSLI